MKLKSILVIVLVAFMSACTTPESFVEDYVQACKEGDSEKLDELDEKYKEIEDELTDEQKQQINDAAWEYLANQLG